MTARNRSDLAEAERIVVKVGSSSISGEAAWRIPAIVDALAEGRSEAEIDRAIDDFFQIGAFLDGGFAAQTDFNLDALEKVIGRRLDDRDALHAQQHQAARWTFIGSGLVHDRFKATLDAISPRAAARIAEAAPLFA